MGASQSLDDRYKDFLSEWIMLQTIIDPRYGQAQIYRSVSGEFACLITKTTTQQIEEKPIQMQLKHPNLVNLYIYDVIKTQDICNSSTKINIVYEYLSNDLLKSIAFRKKQRAMFSEPQIWQILKSVLSSLQYLKQHNLDHQNLTPENILITGSGAIKLLEPNLLGKTSSYIQTLMNIKEEIYLSPEQLDGIKLKKPNIRYDKERSEVFTLGLCMIYAITLEGLKDFLNRNTLEISFPQLQLVVKNIHEILGFSQSLVGFLNLMLQEKPARRPTFQQLLQMLEKNQFPQTESVLNFENNHMKRLDVSNPSLSTTNTPSTIDYSQKDNIWFKGSQKTITSSEPQMMKSSSQKVLPSGSSIQSDRCDQTTRFQGETIKHFGDASTKTQQVSNLKFDTKDDVKTTSIPLQDTYFISKRSPQNCQNNLPGNSQLIKQTQQTLDTVKQIAQGNLSHRIQSNFSMEGLQKPVLTHRDFSLTNVQSQEDLRKQLQKYDRGNNFENTSDWKKNISFKSYQYPVPLNQWEDKQNNRLMNEGTPRAYRETQSDYNELLQKYQQIRFAYNPQQDRVKNINDDLKFQFSTNFQNNYKYAPKTSNYQINSSWKPMSEYLQ